LIALFLLSEYTEAATDLIGSINLRLFLQRNEAADERPGFF